jgi:hypothetical protein
MEINLPEENELDYGTVNDPAAVHVVEEEEDMREDQTGNDNDVHTTNKEDTTNEDIGFDMNSGEIDVEVVGDEITNC